MNRRALLTGASLLAVSRALAQPQPLTGPVGGRRQARGPLFSLNAGPPGVTLDLSFMTPGTLPTGVTFTRGSTATFVNSAGTIQTAATNAPRWDYNPNTLALNGLLIEESRGNTLLQSGTMTVSPWTPNRSTATAGASVAPDGTTSAARLIEDSTASATHYTSNIVAGVAVNQPVTGSVYVRDVSRRWGQLILYDNLTPANNVTASFDLQSGTISAPVIAGGSTAASTAITNAGNGWWRISITATVGTAAQTGIIFRMQMCNAMAGNVYTGNGTSAFDMWGAQLEVGGFPTSYISTTSAGVTRSADVATIASIPGRNTAAESFAAEALLITSQETNSRIIGSATTAAAPLYATAARNAGVTDTVASLVSANAFTLGAVAKMASTWTTPNAGQVCLNAGAVAAAATMTSGFAGVTSFKFMGDSVATDQSNGYIRRFRYWPRALTVAELQQVTT